MADFAQAASKALKDGELRANFRRAMDGLMAKRAAQFPDPDRREAMRVTAESIRQRALSQLPELLERLEANAAANGITVHWAETTQEANGIVLSILRRHNARHVVKGKSMVSEEMELNHFLEGHGIESLESDLGEYIIQLDGTPPSHIIMPAIHMNRRQIARLFSKKIREARYTEEVDALTALARKVLRRKFAEADVGISGVNFAVAETGTLCLVENEGNGRMSTTVPPVHIALMGLEKVVERLDDVPPLLSVLTRSATGQPITTYVNMISGPRKSDEKDGPREVHLVILDNGRSRIFADAQTRRTLQCIRCGACINHCPVYARIGGHAYQSVYPGPIGAILMPQIEGMAAKGDLTQASSLCNACVEVCPVRIPIAELLVRLRTEGVARQPVHSTVKGAGIRRRRLEALVWRGWRWMHESGTRYRLLSRWLGRLDPLLPTAFGPLKAWTSVRAKPHLAKRTLHDLVREKGIDDA